MLTVQAVSLMSHNRMSYKICKQHKKYKNTLKVQKLYQSAIEACNNCPPTSTVIHSGDFSTGSCTTNEESTFVKTPNDNVITRDNIS